MKQEKQKKCSRCGNVKSIYEFNKKTNSKIGLSPSCRKCHNDYCKYKRIKKPIIKELFNEGEKRCSRCKEIKSFSEFGVDKRELNGLKHSCKQCRNKYDNKTPYINGWRKILENTLVKMGRSKNGKTIDLLGYSALELKEHIASLFTDGMSWDNYGEWHIDHIKEIHTFDKNTPPNIVNELSNLRPLWATTREINGVVYEGNLNRKRNINNKNMKNKTKLSIFDFDGTLIETPLPEEGKLKWGIKKGIPWPYEGYWGRHESLDMDIFDMPTVDDVEIDYNREKANPDTIMVMLTGRMIKLKDYVKKILDSKGFEFDEYCYNRGGNTDIEKMRTMETLLDKYPNVVELEMWDDRMEHIPTFEQWGKAQCLNGRLKEFSINLVPANRH